ncbi:hypothetical protein JCM3765_002576 [Sporobolomyces pararoseus]
MDSSDSSFVMVDHNTPPPAQDQLQALSKYFPSLSKSSNFVYSQQALVDQINSYRSQAPDGRLFIDELLSLAGLNGSAIYPPQSPNELQSIILQILSSPSLSSLNISSILYYLALSCSPSTATEFAQTRLLPPEFSLSIRAFHSLDSGEYDLGIRLLSDPRIRQPDFVAKTIKLLAVAPGAKFETRYKLVLAYWRLTGLELTKEEGKIGVEEAELVLRALCDAKRKRGVGEAWDLARQWGEEKEIERLMKAILASCFGDNHTRLPVAQHLQSLISFPFTAAELALLTSFCVSPPTSLPSTAHSLAADWFLSLLISSSKPLQALVFYHKLRTNGKLEPSEERERLLKALEATLTVSQKTSLSIEIASLSSSAAARPSSTSQQAAPLQTTTTSSSITQPAWVPPPSTTAPAPSTPIRTLAAARQSKLPPPAAPTPKSTDLPLSASPFVRKDGGAGQGVLKALREQQHQPGGMLGSPAKLGTPARSGVLPSFGTTVGGSVRNGGSQYTESVVGGNDEAMGTPQKIVKPTLAGFGSVRQQPQAQLQRMHSSSMQQDIEMDQDDYREEEEDQEEDEVMLVPSPKNQTQPALPVPAASTSTSTPRAAKQDDFSRRIALDPTIQKTLLAASTASKKALPPPSPAPTSKKGNEDTTSSLKTPKRSRTSQREAAKQQQPSQDRGDMKRRAVSSEPPSGEGKGKESSDREKPDQDRTVKLPPGAFPGMEEDQPESNAATTRRSSRAGSSQPEMRERNSLVSAGGPRTSTRRSTAANAAARRSTRSRSTSVAPEEESQDDDVEKPTPRRKSSRASSLQPPEMSEVSKTPVRRSSRLSSSSNNPAATTRRTTRRGQKAIEEEEDDQGEEE